MEVVPINARRKGWIKRKCRRLKGAKTKKRAMSVANQESELFLGLTREGKQFIAEERLKLANKIGLTSVIKHQNKWIKKCGGNHSILFDGV